MSVRHPRPNRPRWQCRARRLALCIAFWYCNNWDFNALGTILERASKTTVYEDFKQRIADAVGLEDFRLEDCSYVRGPDSIHAAYPFRMTHGTWRASACSTSEMAGGAIARWCRATGSPRAPGPTRTPARGRIRLLVVGVLRRPAPHVGLLQRRGVLSPGLGRPLHLVVPYLNMVVVHRVNTDEQGRQVTNSQFGHLVQLIMNARR